MENKKKYIYDKEKIKNYSDTFYEKNKDRLKNKIICDVCSGSYCILNRTHHINTNKHKTKLNKIDEELNNNKSELINELKKKYTIEEIKKLFNI